jgi:hypothetical protein
MTQNWHPLPLHTHIVELLERNGGTYTNVELFKELKEKNTDLNMRYFNKILMKLEISGIIRVTELSKNKQNIELLSNIS